MLGISVIQLPANGCGPIYEEETALSLILEKVAGEAVLWEEYEESWTDVDARTVNIMEWQDFLWKNAEGAIASNEIEHLLYETSLDTVKQLYEEFQENPVGTMREGDYPPHLFRRMSPDTVDYILFAKQCEAHVSAGYDPWKGIERDKAAMQALLEEGRKRYTQTYADFLKLRYAYQLVRLARYMGNYAAA
jgi:hypothetical protein